jgi:hypothetical protein
MSVKKRCLSKFVVLVVKFLVKITKSILFCSMFGLSIELLDNATLKRINDGSYTKFQYQNLQMQ